MPDHPADNVPFTGTPRFEVVRPLGVGGMGAVYEARDRERDTTVALKTLRTTDPDALFYLKNEFRSLQDLRHRNLVSLGELFEVEGRWFFTMELIDGVDLISWVRGGTALYPSPLPAEVATDLMARASAKPPPPPAPRPKVRFDEARLRDALGQLARGLCALHDAGKIHRDIKPSNILVDQKGRLVLVDFGLAAELVRGRVAAEAYAVGTMEFMAPEQAHGPHVTPAADWYAVGVALYQALTGELPFSGAQVLRQKANVKPTPVQRLNARAPADLSALCHALLELDPAARPSGREVLRRLGLEIESAPRAFFVGRAEELRALHAALADSRAHAVSALIVGDSGVGKSTLARELLDELRRSRPDCVILSGRCYERESVPYKAFDGVVDALSQHLGRLAPEACAPLVPPDAAVLTRIFPVLRRVSALAAPSPESPADPQLLRARAFAALRALLEAIARARPLVVHVDDLQWADGDSLLLLDDLLQPPSPPSLLLLATLRGEPSARLARLGDVRRLPLSPLSADEGRRLAAELLGAERAPLADAVAAEARGLPLFLVALARYATEFGELAAVKLDDALQSQVDRLDAAERRLLELSAVAGTPLASDTATAAAGLDRAAYAAGTASLRVAHLLRTSGGDQIEPYHDRIRETVVERLAPSERQRCHRALADALESTGHAAQDPQSLVRHLEGAGELGRAARQAEHAAAHAFAALAFEQSAGLYRTALRLDDHGEADRRRLRLALAQSLTNAGRGAEAAEVYLECVPGAGAAERLEYRRRAADHLTRSGHVERGIQTLSDVLAEIGEAFAKKPRRALLQMLAHRLRLRLRGFAWTPREERLVPPAQLEKIEVYWTVSICLGLIDNLRAGVFQARGMRLALDVGEPRRLGRALVLDAWYTSVMSAGGTREGRKKVAEARRIAAETDDAYLTAVTALTDAYLDYISGEYHSAHPKFVEAETLLRRTTLGTYFELGAAVWFRHLSLRQQGLLGELSRTYFDAIRDAERRDDRFIGTSMRLNMNVVWLARDQPDEARRDLERPSWAPPEGGMHLQHWYKEYARCEVDLYCAEAEAGLSRLRPFYRELSRSLVLRIRNHRVLAHWLLGRMVLAASKEPRALDEAGEMARRLASEDMTYATIWSLLLRGAIERRRGQAARAEETLTRALELGERHHFPAGAQAARWRLGELVGGDRGRALLGSARSWMLEQQIRNPERLMALWAPD
jgi:hypothetical protein